ncbi:MAG TPA: 3-dehydroquinate synthase [bacterium]|jgi:3-dehydroquinate synthase|nr:3-dehydroquinate synthase [Dictyoglomota bacterium]HHV81056.1 3-dehydroquinate synthase [bacterium]HOK29009.1 3-dehydroquinate synthase [bacterium]HPC77211.1 3-dehydroquinate synthase [bacterium]HPO81331.1 3-dehydroquinate synthase [bacterium]
MKTIKVRLKENSYNIYIGKGILDQFNGLFPSKEPRKALLVTNETVWKLYGKRTVDSINDGFVNVITLILPDGERYKTLRSVEKGYRTLVENKFTRSDCIINLGGGVICDTGGYIAATYMRGIDFYQIPTTLLAQVDASIGGKVAVNLPQGKNLVGTFYQPDGVLIDIDFLNTLPKREFNSGWAEIIKAGILDGENFFSFLERGRYPIISPIEKAIRLKERVVRIDERDRGLRKILNLGHTFAHAIESATNYRRYLHGEAVSIGMMYAIRLGEAIGVTDETLKDRVKVLLERFELPVELKGIDPQRLIPYFYVDKKATTGSLSFIIPLKIGDVREFKDVKLEILGGILR